jgi:hypothetical protein
LGEEIYLLQTQTEIRVLPSERKLTASSPEGNAFRSNISPTENSAKPIKINIKAASHRSEIYHKG